MGALVGNAGAIWDVCGRFSADSAVGRTRWSSVEVDVMLGRLEVNDWDIGVLGCAGLTRDSLARNNRILEGVEIGVQRTWRLLSWVKMHDLVLNKHRALMSTISSTYSLLPQMVLIYKDLRWNRNIRKYRVIILARELISSSSKVFIISLDNHLSRQVILHKDHLSRRVSKDLHPRYSIHICQSKVLLPQHSILRSVLFRSISGVEYLQCLKSIDGHDIGQRSAQTHRSTCKCRSILWLGGELAWILLRVV